MTDTTKTPEQLNTEQELRETQGKLKDAEAQLAGPPETAAQKKAREKAEKGVTAAERVRADKRKNAAALKKAASEGLTHKVIGKRGISCRSGMLDIGDKCSAHYFGGGKEALDRLVEKGFLDKI